MSTRPWMPFYPADYYRDTNHLSTEEHGAYILLILHYWQCGSLPDDDGQLSRITRLPPKRWRAIRPIIRAFFGDGWHHKRIEFEIAKAKAGYARRVRYLKQADERRLPPEEWSVLRMKIFARDNYTCTYCGKRGSELECDHIVPVARGGSNEESNLTTACRPCNQTKGTLLVEEWLGEDA